MGVAYFSIAQHAGPGETQAEPFKEKEEKHLTQKGKGYHFCKVIWQS